MRALLALATSFVLALGLGSAPAGARAAAEPDPAAYDALSAAVRSSYLTSWRREGGSYVRRCTADGESSTYRRKRNVATGTSASVVRGDGSVPTVAVERGRLSYSKTPAEVRRSLRVHRAPVPARWVQKRIPRGLGMSPDLWGDHGPPVDGIVWNRLSMTALPGGGAAFAGESTVSASGYRMVAAATTDGRGRLVRLETRAEWVDEQATVVRTRACVETWTWSRPRLSVPRHSDTRNAGKRLAWERFAVGEAVMLTWQAEKRLRAGAGEAQVRAWLHAQVAPRNRLAAGVRLVVAPARKRAARPPVAFTVVVRDGEASYRPVR